ncbi:hypothetical protein [Telmatospirillum siberiense]|uniref:Uncharacterized protein n=1 Tax=Telmatospirillum siberiense TaxID=382514 RepID=A0A2N3PP07_9PROT|nr:hypothetical protein [Telmatospirillum siberiense]PKU22149.1 hypothetical protein CWS72_23225 [Telmatospirillum siberiense]
MGQVNLTNTTGSSVTITNFTVNNSPIQSSGTVISSGDTSFGTYNEQPWKEYSDLDLQITVNGTNWQINLNTDHYFGGGDFHYPGQGSDVTFTLIGLQGSSGQSLQLLLSYSRQDADYLIASQDQSKLLNIVN